ncbi:MAG: N-acetyl-D-myo-inositol-2-amino-2-deoxy-alpha-D-glucopyranoside deacetylase [Actinomycetota bacterium]|nr:N-acetyl-D-myo-inositol-2-amino-2-deoxy-alpha-D-glucopyranoside deacetylase [Actinomycetota bacterium]
MAPTASRRLLLVHAHPDDESINNGATMARHVAGGAHVALVTCTRGEQGEIIPADLAYLRATSGEALGAYRAGELAAAMAALGVTDHRFLDEIRLPGEDTSSAAPVRYRDSGMVWGADGRAREAPEAPPGAFYLADVDATAARLAAVVRALRPQVVVTYGPDGGYGHPDHVQAHRVTLRAADLAADPGPGGEPWAVPKIYWTLPEDRTDPGSVTTVVDGAAHLGAKVAAMKAHATQLTVRTEAPATFALSNGIRHPLTAKELYRLVRGTPGGPRDADGRETTLFGGLPGVRCAELPTPGE